MKRNVFLLVSAVILLAGCNTDVWQMAGEYSYKISGRVEITSEDDDVVRSLPDEMGVLRILQVDNKSDEVMLTMNQLGGSVFTTSGTIAEKKIEIEEFERTVKVAPVALEKEFTVTVNGYGERYGNTIVFYLAYEGETEDGEYQLSGEGIQMVADRNGERQLTINN